MSDLSNLPRPDGAHRPAKRVGRGPGSGTGKTAGRGHKGQKARTGHHGIPAWFEGGQMPLQRRLPKRGFTNRSRVEFEVVNVGDLARVDGTDITPETLSAHRLVDAGRGPVKLLGNGDTDRKLSVRVHAISASARQKIEAAGGSVELIERATARTDAADETQTAGDETPAADTGADASGNADDAAEK